MNQAERQFAEALTIDWTRNKEGRSNSSATFNEIADAITSSIVQIVSVLNQAGAEEYSRNLLACLAHDYLYAPQKLGVNQVLEIPGSWNQAILWEGTFVQIEIHKEDQDIGPESIAGKEMIALTQLVATDLKKTHQLSLSREQIVRLAGRISWLLAYAYGMAKTPVTEVSIYSWRDLRGRFMWNGVRFRCNKVR